MTESILFLPGMTPDPRTFDRLLPLLDGGHVVPWIPPRPGEPLASYARRLANGSPAASRPVVCGLSFGGIVAQEMAPIVNARHCVLISSVRRPDQLPPWFRLLRPIGWSGAETVFRWVGILSQRTSTIVRSTAMMRLAKFSGEHGPWYRWATAAVLKWQPTSPAVATTQIHGDRDTTFPVRYLKPDVVIPGGGHTLPLSHPQELAVAIRRILSDLKN